MEDELRCPTCKQLFANPVLLPCFHALCLGCALDIQTPYTPGAILASVTGGTSSLNGGTIHSVAATIHPHPSGAASNHHTHSHTHATTRHSSNSSAASTASSATGSESVTSDQDQADKVSILSEADSGVVCCSNTSRPVSYAGTGHIQGLLQGAASAPPGAAFSLTCPLCRKIVFFDEGGVRNLAPYRAMESIVDRFCAREALRCQMCETDPKVASLVCEQCEIRYCDACRELCHPARGPLAKHTLVKPKGAAQQRESVCGEHEDILSMYCLTCKMPACPECINDQRHPQHEVQPISTTCKAQKVFPVFFILTNKKSAKCYAHLFNYINSNVLNLNGATFITDCEASLRRAIKISFLDAKIYGCWFHFCQAVRRQITTKHKQLSQLIRQNNKASLEYHKLLSLPLLPAMHILGAFGKIKKDIETLERHFEFSDFLEYFEKQWLQKTELSHNLQQLSEKARSTTEFIQRLKGMSDKVTESCIEFERLVAAQCEALIQAIHDRREYLLEAIRMDKDTKIRILKDQQSNCTGKLQQTTGLIQFCIEALKETDSAAFLQVGSMLINRVANTDMTWHQEVTNAAPRVSPIVDLTLDDASVLRAIDNLNFIQMKPAKDGDERLPAAPQPPAIIPEDCSAENNSVTVAWQAPNHSFVEGYVLELDDGSGGEFREVYCGKESICTVDGLHFNSMYNARVKAFNSAGEGEYSELIGLQTAEVAWFTFDPVLSGGPGSGLIFSNNNSTVSVEGWEHRVALGSVGFSRGIHYWEFTIDNYTADTDPAFGVARIDVNRNKMLGKDEKSFAMYIDRQRSWFQHNSIHERRVEGGISTSSTIGVLLNLERHTLSFLVNGMPQGSIAFRDLYGVFYPAVSINRGVTLTMHSPLDAPQMDYF